MQQAAKTAAVAVALVTAVWSIDSVGLFGVVTVPTAIAAALLVVYFDWRAKLLSGLREQRQAAY